MRQVEEEEEEEPVQAKGETTPVVTPGIKAELEATRGSGEPLSRDIRAFMEPRFGRDFGAVRVHTGARAASLARELRAQAFTRGADVYFGTGKYAPGTSAGKRLLAHELAHTMQQNYGILPAYPTSKSKKLYNFHEKSGVLRRKPLKRSPSLWDCFMDSITRYKKFIPFISVKFNLKKDVPQNVWKDLSKHLKGTFPGVRKALKKKKQQTKREDYKFLAGTGYAFYYDPAIGLYGKDFPVSGGAIHGYKQDYGRFWVTRKKMRSAGGLMLQPIYYVRGVALHGCGGIIENYCLDVPSHGCVHVPNNVIPELYKNVWTHSKTKQWCTMVIVDK